MNIPTLCLHHYTSGHGLIGIFDSRQIWATSIHCLNDSREFSHAIDLGKTAIQKILAPSDDPKAKVLFNSIAQHLDSVSKLASYVTCFSTVDDSLSQWRGYCPRAFGYSIGFDGELLREIAESQGFRLERCIYDRRQQETTVNQWARRAVDRLMPGLAGVVNISSYVETNSGPFLSEFVEFAPFLKDTAFKDEKEWRLAGLVYSNDPRLRLRAGRSMLIRYLPIDLKLNHDHPLIWSVRVGPTPHPDLATDAVCHYFNKIQIQNGVSPSQIPYRDW